MTLPKNKKKPNFSPKPSKNGGRKDQSVYDDGKTLKQTKALPKKTLDKRSQGVDNPFKSFRSDNTGNSPFPGSPFKQEKSFIQQKFEEEKAKERKNKGKGGGKSKKNNHETLHKSPVPAPKGSETPKNSTKSNLRGVKIGPDGQLTRSNPLLIGPNGQLVKPSSGVVNPDGSCTPNPQPWQQNYYPENSPFKKIIDEQNRKKQADADAQNPGGHVNPDGSCGPGAKNGADNQQNKGSDDGYVNPDGSCNPVPKPNDYQQAKEQAKGKFDKQKKDNQKKDKEKKDHILDAAKKLDARVSKNGGNLFAGNSLAARIGNSAWKHGGASATAKGLAAVHNTIESLRKTAAAIAKRIIKIVHRIIMIVSSPVFYISLGVVLLLLYMMAWVFTYGNNSISCSYGDAFADSSSSSSGGARSIKEALKSPEAKAIYKWLVEKRGFTGAGAAGVLAVAYRESNFKPDAVNERSGNAGIFQWGGFTSDLNYTRILATGKIKKGDRSTLTLDNELDLMDKELKSNRHGAALSAGKATDPVDAAKKWSVDFEGVGLDDEKQTKVGSISQWAKEACDEFHCQDDKGDESKLNETEGVANSASQYGATRVLTGDKDVQCMVDGNSVDLAGLNGIGLTEDQKKLMEDFKKYIKDHPGIGAQIAAYAAQFAGKVPYVWGGESETAGMDCSGLVMMTMRHFGVNLPHYSGDQANLGTPVASLADAQVGDVVANGTHAAFLSHKDANGNWYVINAANPQEGIKFSPLSAAFSGAYSIRRMK